LVVGDVVNRDLRCMDKGIRLVAGAEGRPGGETGETEIEWLYGGVTPCSEVDGRGAS
jgi:hypothetical protein